MEQHQEVFFSTVTKKLSSAWSAGSLSRQLSPSLLDSINSNFRSLEKKVKMRILLSFLGLDATRRSELSQSLLRSLRLAAEEETSEVWVSVTARLVYERLFGGGLDLIDAGDDTGMGMDAILGSSSSSSSSVLVETSEAIIHRLIEWSCTDAGDDESSSYFQPLEYKYLSPTWVAQLHLESTTANNDLHFVGSAPDFIAREKQRLTHTQQEGAQATSLMRVKMDNSSSSREMLQLASSSSSSSSNAGERGNGRAEIKKSKPPAAADKRGTSKLISLEDIKAAAEAARGPEKISGAKRKATVAAASATTAATATTTTSAAATGTSSTPDSKVSKVTKVEDRDNLTAEGITALEEAAGLSIAAAASAAAAAAAEATAGPPAAAANIGYASICIDTEALFAESPLLSEEDRDIICKFFSDDWALTFGGLNLPPRRMKMREVETSLGKTETFTLVLNFDDHSYQKIKKSKTTKPLL